MSFHTHDFIFSTLMITTLGMHIWSSSVGTQVSLTSFRLYLTWPEKYWLHFRTHIKS